MLRKVRISLAAVFLIGITLLFAGIGHQWWGWMAKLQFLPSFFALNIAVLAGIILLTLLLGRIYCSVICPMGVFQDAVNYLSSKRKGKARRFKFHKEYRAVRTLVLFLFLLAIGTGMQWIVGLIAPYSAYGRMVRTVLDLSGATGIIVGVVTFIVISVCAWFWGREWCSTICPVGTILSLFSRFSIFRPVIDKDKCVHCGLCGKKCKSSCIDTFEQDIDYSRCVVCMDCIDNCNTGAIKYVPFWKAKSKPQVENKEQENKPDTGRRAFMAGIALLGGSAIAKADGGFAEVKPKQNPQRKERLTPAGSTSAKDFYSRCTACGLCISNCPNNVLRPSTDLEHFMQPEMGYDKGYCRPECTNCSQVCPTGAILKIVPEQKSAIKIGTAHVNSKLCISVLGIDSCGNCARHCPSGAIRMVGKEGHLSPKINKELCIGCGACENLCPVRPISAITVNGLSTHEIL